MMVMTYLKKFPMILEKVSDDGDDILEKVFHDDCEDIIEDTLEVNFDNFTQL